MGLDWSRLFCFWNGARRRVGMCTMRKLINRKYVDPSIPGIAWQLATWERNQSGPIEANFAQYYTDRLDAAIRSEVRSSMKGGFNG